MTWFGWDASDFDADRGPMDIGAAVRDGISFFTHKATEGTKVVHRNYRLALERARDVGMPVYGAYFVPRTPGNNGHGSIAAQVAFFVAYLDSQTPWWRTDPRFRILQVDTEHWSDSNGVVYDAVPASIGARACELLSGYGKYVPHYAPGWAYGNGIPGADPLWSSNYGNNPAVHFRDAYTGDGSSRWTPYSGRVPAILQYGSRTTIGSQPTCDADAIKDPAVWAAIVGEKNVMAGTKAERIIEAWAEGSELTSQSEGVGPVTWVKTQGAQLNSIEVAVKRIEDKLSGAVPVTLAPGQMAELAAKLPTAADIVTELLARVPRA